MVQLSKFEEEALRIWVDEYQKSSMENYELKLNLSLLPEYIKNQNKTIFSNLNKTGLITVEILNLSGSYVVKLTPEALEYFDEQDAYVLANMPDALPKNAEILLNEILTSKLPKLDIEEKYHLMCKKGVDADEILGILAQLKEKGFIDYGLGGNYELYALKIKNEGKTYFERRKSFLNNMQQQTTTTAASVYNITGSNVVFGNAINSTMSIDNSIHEIEKLIDEQGGKEASELKELLAEVKDVIDNMKDAGKVIKNTGLFKRLNQHIQNHGWFYGAVIQLLGQAALMVMGGQP